MKAQLKALHSPDIDLYSYIPEDTSNFVFLLQAMIGLYGEKGADTFDMLACTVK